MKDPEGDGVDEDSATGRQPITDWTAILDEIDLLHPIIRVLLRYRQMIRMAVQGAGVYSIGVGMGTYFSGELRLENPSWTVAVDFADIFAVDPNVFWGASAIAFGLTVLVPVRKVSMCGLFAVIVWSTFLALSHLVSINLEPLAAVSGIYAHSFIALVVTGLFTVRLVDRRI